MALSPPAVLSGTAASTGIAVLRFNPRGPQVTLVRQVAPECATGIGAVCAVRYNGYLITPANPVADACAQDPPLPLWPTDQMTVEWTGLAAGAVVKATVLFELVDEGY